MPYYIGNLKGDPNLENYPNKYCRQQVVIARVTMNFALSADDFWYDYEYICCDDYFWEYLHHHHHHHHNHNDCCCCCCSCCCRQRSCPTMLVTANKNCRCYHVAINSYTYVSTQHVHPLICTHMNIAFMCVRVYIYIYTYVYMCVCMGAHKLCVYIYIHICLCIHIYIYIYICMYTYLMEAESFYRFEVQQCGSRTTGFSRIKR